MPTLPPVIQLSSLNGTSGFRLDGIAAYDGSGRSVASAGDVNGDGFDDVIVGAPGANPNYDVNGGESYVVFGKASGFAAAIQLSTLNGSDGFRLDGINSYDVSGGSVASAGDVNGDGFDDVIIGAYGADPNSNSRAGESYVVFGKASGFAAAVSLSTLDGTNGFRLDGVATGDYSGISVASAGDVNGDGFDDVIVGATFAAPSGRAYAGSSYVVFGKATGFAANIDLSTLNGTTGFRLDGVTAGDVSGRSVASAGDVNNDGFEDLIIGAFGADPNGNVSGSTHVVFGKASGFGSSIDLSTLNGANGFRLDGSATYDRSGRWVSSAGDVNGDGFDDVIVGAYGRDPNGNYSGSSYVVFGKASGFAASINLSTLNGTNGFRLDGVAVYDFSGRSVASAGDVNGDGLDDLIVSAYGSDVNGGAGASYVVYGRGSFTAAINLSTLDGTTGFRLDGTTSGDGTGLSVASAGDVNRDGFDDLIVGAPGADPNGRTSAGSSYVIFGAGPGDFPAVFDLATLNGTNGFRLEGIDPSDYSGYSVSSAGDVNGDGFDDVIVGARGADPNSNSVAGESYVVFGKASGFAATIDLSTLDGANGFRLDGIDADDRSGGSVASAGDVNGDGFDDLIVGAYGGDPNSDSYAGETYVVFGKTSGFAAALDLSALDGANGFRLDGIDADDRSGVSVASAGDVNGDGFDDIIVGASDADPNSDSRAGESYVVFGKASGFAAALDLSALDGADGFRLDGIDADDRSGFSAASAGDVNGDGFGDLVVGAYGGDPNSDPGAGETYVVFGKASGFGSAIDLSTLDGANGFRLDGIDAGDSSGFSAASAGDVNGDGFDDLIVGAYGGDPNSDSRAGASYVVFGKASGFAAALDLSTLDGANGFRLDGIDAGDSSGFSVASAGDVNGDGFDDVIVGAYGGDPNSDTYAGESYVVFGRASGFVAALDLATLDGANGFRLEGIDANDRSAVSVASAGDVNGDGFDDLIVGALRADPGGREAAGESYVIFGRAPTTAVNRVGSAASQKIMGGAFDDTLSGLGGDDTLKGVGGDDLLAGGADADRICGGLGEDTASYAGSGAGVTVDLNNAGPQTSVGDALNDRLSGIENLLGSAQADTLTGNVEANALSGGFGNDRLMGGGSADTLDGGGGVDTLSGNAGLDRLIGGAAGDLLLGGPGADTLDGGLGNDTASYANAGGAVTVDLLESTNNAGDAGGDVFVLIERFILSDFADRYAGNGANNSVNGGEGGDTLSGGDGTDTLLGGLGEDELTGGLANDSLRGNEGADTLAGGEGVDRLLGGDGQDSVDGQIGNDRLFGEDGADTLLGGVDVDTLRGGGGGDSLQGEAGNDRLLGDDGADTLDGGAGRDVLTGGDDGDRFVFSDVAHSPRAGSDILTDFSGIEGGAGEGDTIDLLGIDADTTSAADDDFSYTGGGAFTGVASELIFANGALLGDLDGDRRADLRIVLQGVATAPETGDIIL